MDVVDTDTLPTPCCIQASRCTHLASIYRLTNTTACELGEEIKFGGNVHPLAHTIQATDGNPFDTTHPRK